jgi:hypothetical protein
VNDVFGVVVLAERDEDFLAIQLVGAVALRHRSRAHRGKIGARLRLGQVHRAGPRAGHHLRQEFFLELVRSAQLDGFDRALRQQRAQIEREVCRVPHFLDGGRNELRQALPAVFRILGEAIPAVRTILLVRTLETRRRLDVAAFQPFGAFEIAGPIERIEHVCGELRRLFENGRDRVRRGFLETRQLRHLFESGQLVHHEQDVGQGCVIGAHARINLKRVEGFR